MRIETFSQTTPSGRTLYNARLIADDGSVYSTRLFLKDLRTRRAHNKRVAEAQRSIDAGYRFPLLAQRFAARAADRTSVLGSL